MCLSLQIQNSPLKTLLEIIVKHHIECVQSNTITRNKIDCQQSLHMINSTATSPTVTTKLINVSEEEENTVTDVKQTNTKHTKFRYYASNYFDILLCVKCLHLY